MQINIKIILKTILFIFLFFLALSYTYYYRPLVDDELYGYGFAINILRGLIPYKDFNMIITPLFSYIVAFFILILGKKLIVYHIVISIIITTITYISYKKIKYYSLVIYALLLMYPFTGYNMFSILLLFFLLSLKDDKKRDILEVILISAMILTKQTLGVLIIPSLIYSKNKKKSFLAYLTIGITFILYLLFSNSIYQFFDYCLFGMFDFSSQNSEGINMYFILEIFIIIYLIYQLIKTKKRETFYILMFQIMAFPITNFAHFIISFIPFIYYILQEKRQYINFLISIFLVTYVCFYSIGIMVRDDTYKYVSNNKINNFYQGKMVQNHLNSAVKDINQIIERYPNYRYYLFGNFAYLVKLTNNDSITKYDIINNGNMGYKGSSKYIKEIDKYCKKNKCLFILEYRDQNSTNQTNNDILNHIKKKYYSVINSNVYEVYIN